MRRPCDFVLDKAAWPALLLDEHGAICRANRAAAQTLGPIVQGEPGEASLAALLEDAANLKLDRLLADQAAGAPGELKFNLAGGQKARFLSRVTKISREGQNYFVLQLFNGPGTPIPPVTDTSTWVRAKEARDAASSTPTSFLDAMEVPFALTNSDWPSFVVDKLGVIIRANPAASRVFGSAARKGANLALIWTTDNAVPLERVLAAPTRGDSQPARLRAESGTVLPFLAQVCPAAQSKWVLLQFFKDLPQSPVPALASAAPSAAAVKPSDDFLLQEAEWPAFLVRKTGQVVRANRAAVRAFGSAVESADSSLSAIWPTEHRDSLDQFLSLPPPANPPRLRFKLKSGLPAVYLAQLSNLSAEDVCLLQLLKESATTASPAPPPTAGAPGAAGTAEALAIQRQRLDCALQLARSVALDFNNALTSILGHSSLLLGQSGPDHPWRGSLVQIEKSAAKAAEVASDLASFSLQEKDARTQTAGNLNTLLERTLEALQGSLPRPLTITRNLERKLFTVNFDEAKMQQALVRVLENAVEAIKNEGRITVETRNLQLTRPTQDGAAKLSPGQYVCVEISDNGPGIADEVMPHLFEPFYTTKGSKHRGLGLAWVYGIVTNHGGGVAISNASGGGARVRLYLPANAQIVRDTPLALTDLRGSQTILFVDDEDLLLTMAQMVLSSFGYTVLTANNGQKALDLFNHWKDSIDLILVDLVMPIMSGRELTEQIRKIAPRTRIVWCSGVVRTGQAEEESSYLQKPFTSQDLLRTVKQALANGADPPAPPEA